jgi:hypothetical protein
MRLTWTFAVLFVLCGLPLFVAEDEAWRRWSAGLSTLSLGAFALAWARHAVAVGQIKLQHQHRWIRVANQPRTFWATVAMLVVTGTGVIVAAIWALFFKA